MNVGDAFLDLVLGSSCVGCAAPGRPLCPGCTAALPRRADAHASTAHPTGPVPSYVTGDYEGTLRAMVIAHKERRVLGLTRPLGALLGAAAEGALRHEAEDPAAPVVLVPVPSRARAVRLRGHDPTLAMTRRAAGTLHPTARVVVGRLLRLRPGVVDQAGLDTTQRMANLRGSMAADSAAVRRLAGRLSRAHVVLCDDVVTTGATLREAQRALRAVGVDVLAGACVAATPRRIETPRSR